MRVDHLVHKAGLTQGDASEIEAAGHDAKADCRDLRRESELVPNFTEERVKRFARILESNESFIDVLWQLTV